MTKETLLAELEQTTQALCDLLLCFTPESFHQKPSGSGWSAAQVADHLVKVYASTNGALHSESIPTNRPPDEKIALLRRAMEDTGTKRVAPERVQPSEQGGDPSTLASQLQAQEEALRKAIAVADLTEACTQYRHPSLGTMTKMEWVAFNNYHTQRHIKQLQRFLGNVLA
ncbi:DinB family protein [Flavisolibacter nicotianae]|uniref:DinB family protein n=1 Tax=Flavisolibacter nicotianae TaxID=2364882 RepID=UPI000EAFC237|nr:DinB family protein [Flavisolibacter nicotianae]